MVLWAIHSCSLGRRAGIHTTGKLTLCKEGGEWAFRVIKMKMKSWVLWPLRGSTLLHTKSHQKRFLWRLLSKLKCVFLNCLQLTLSLIMLVDNLQVFSILFQRHTSYDFIQVIDEKCWCRYKVVWHWRPPITWAALLLPVTVLSYHSPLSALSTRTSFRATGSLAISLSTSVFFSLSPSKPWIFGILGSILGNGERRVWPLLSQFS